MLTFGDAPRLITNYLCVSTNMASLNPVASSVEASAVSTNAIVAAGYLNKEKSSDLAQLFGKSLHDCSHVPGHIFLLL